MIPAWKLSEGLNDSSRRGPNIGMSRCCLAPKTSVFAPMALLLRAGRPAIVPTSMESSQSVRMSVLVNSGRCRSVGIRGTTAG